MRKAKILSVSFMTVFTLLVLSTTSSAQFGIGADVVSRYIFRGTDFGNSASVQPSLTFVKSGFEIGAWGSYAITADGAGTNENDLYVSYSIGSASIVVTDYYFPETADFFNYKDSDGVHILEVGASYGLGPASLSAYYNFSGDSDNSFYTEIGYDVPYEIDDISVSLFAGFGNGVYTSDTDFNAVNIGLTVKKASWSASYILNPEAETNYLVFGKSF
jgi:hypothetical protein